MLLIDQYKYVRSRADFFVTLDLALRQASELLARSPHDGAVGSIRAQLEAMRRWTDAGREPTREERRSLTIGPLLVRELEPAPTDELAEWVDRVREVAGHFRDWLDDATFASIDEDELGDFPDG